MVPEEYMISQHKLVCENKWAKVLSLQDYYNKKCIFINYKSLTKDTPLFWIQFRILHIILCGNIYTQQNF